MRVCGLERSNVPVYKLLHKHILLSERQIQTGAEKGGGSCVCVRLCGCVCVPISNSLTGLLYPAHLHFSATTHTHTNKAMNQPVQQHLISVRLYEMAGDHTHELRRRQTVLSLL